MAEYMPQLKSWPSTNTNCESTPAASTPNVAPENNRSSCEYGSAMVLSKIRSTKNAPVADTMAANEPKISARPQNRPGDLLTVANIEEKYTPSISGRNANVPG